MKKAYSQAVTLACLFLLHTSASAFKIDPASDIHETMTRFAKACFDEAVNAGRQTVDNCTYDPGNEPVGLETWWIEDSNVYPDLEQAARWPDDPTRQINAIAGGKFAANMLGNCERIAQNSPDGKVHVNNGLLCNSHYGDMQFFHAQASELGENGMVTYRKVMDWATFLYEVASGKLSNADLDQDYCSYFTGQSAFHQSMLPSSNSVPCEAVKDPAWTLTTLFTFKCLKPINSRGCGEEKGTSRHNKARIYATGALLHLVQDSFSQSHAERGSCEYQDETMEKAVSKVECLPPTLFTTFRGQKRHGDADQEPRWSANCDASANIDDPVTASAKILMHIHMQSPTGQFISDLERVFGSREHAKNNVRDAELGQCFGP